MNTTFEHTVPTAVVVAGRTVEIERGAIWDVCETHTETQVSLSDCDDRDLIGLTICLDWSQGRVRPDSVTERVEAILQDADILESHVALHLAA
jgi:hypothetical protein